MKKRTVFIRTIAIAVLLLTLAGQCFAGVNPFTDISDLKDKDKIIALQEQGIIKGTGNGLFKSEASITAAQGIQLLVNAFDLNIDNIKFIKEPKATDYFTKADNNAWYANAFIIAPLNGLDLQADLDPNAKWTREEFTYYLVNTMEKQGNLPKIKLVPVTIKDSDQINILYSGTIQRALLYKLVQLDKDGSYHPKDEISRKDAVIQVYDALEYLKEYPAPTTK